MPETELPQSDVPIETVARLHDLTTMLHAFIYFAPEAAEEYDALGVAGRGGYFASRTAAMGPLPTEMVIATFYNFSPDLVTAAMDGMWDRVSAPEMQAARWRAAARVLDAHVQPVMAEDAVAEAIEITEAAVAGLAWPGRPMAAGNAAILPVLAESELGPNRLLHLWQLATILREWRGDLHIGLLIAEPLDGAECTMVSAALTGSRGDMIRKSRAWPDDDWQAAIARLTERGWVEPDGAITEHGRTARARIEERTNELSRVMWSGVGDERARRLGGLLVPATEALLAGNYFALMGRPAKG